MRSLQTRRMCEVPVCSDRMNAVSGASRPAKAGHYEHEPVCSDRIHAVQAHPCRGEYSTMYDYRRLPPAERAAVVERRRSCGFPFHKPPHLEQGTGWYFITAATFEHRRHFAAPLELTALERRPLEALAGAELPCGGWVILPNHYHFLVRTTTLATVGNALGPVHGRSAHYTNRRDG